jgi:hypothetical protein
LVYIVKVEGPRHAQEVLFFIFSALCAVFVKVTFLSAVVFGFGQNVDLWPVSPQLKQMMSVVLVPLKCVVFCEERYELSLFLFCLRNDD